MHDTTRLASNNMMLFPPMPELDSIKYYKQALQVSVHHFYIIDEIGEVPPFLDMINVLKTAEQHDTIFIYLNTPGGNLYTAIQIISAIRQSNATVVTCIEGMVASAGTIIFLAGHKHVVNANCSFMIHNYSHGVWGKGNEVNLRVKHSEQYFKKLAHDIYDGFLTEYEINEVLNGKDFWMESEELLERLGTENSADSVNALMNTLSGDIKPVDAVADAEEEVMLEALIVAATAALAAAEAESTEVVKPAPRMKRKPKPKKA
jgi:ATP-dependent protease ClpP protease subunit